MSLAPMSPLVTLSSDPRTRLKLGETRGDKLRAPAPHDLTLEDQPRVLIVDDDKNLLTALDLALTRRGFRVRSAEGAGEAFEQIQREPGIELIVLDVMMPGMDGVAALRLLRNSSSAPVLMLSAKDAVVDRLAGFEAGADDYLVKPFDLDELVARLLALRRRAREQQPKRGELSYGDVFLDDRSWVARRGDRDLSLTPTEFRILQAFLKAPGTVHKRDDLILSVWGPTWSDSGSSSLEVHIANLRQKLEDEGQVRLIHTVRGIGYILKE
ncbi:MAG: response regulator transcription factor [Chloroflexi bacterium]|nr:MAG: response regulator transcription factor [Chloroflexota bacterium]